MRVGELLRPISGAMAQELLAGNYIQADETPVGVQPESVRGKNHQAYLWQYSRPSGVVVFDFRATPAAVSTVLRRLRSKSLTPISSSRARICRLSAG
jgi:hypothetical protein